MTPTPYSAESAAELARQYGAWNDISGSTFKMDARELSILLNAALSQQAAPGVAGELLRAIEIADAERLRIAELYQKRIDTDCSEMNGNMDFARLEGAVDVVQALRRAASQPHPTGDTQQEAVSRVTVAEDWETGEEVKVLETNYELLKKLPIGAGLYANPPAATALAQQVKDKAVEIVRKQLADKCQMPVTASDIEEAIAAIPIPEPRPEHKCEKQSVDCDALVAMAYRNAAEIVQRNANKYDEAYVSVCIDEITALTPPDAQDALEELCM